MKTLCEKTIDGQELNIDNKNEFKLEETECIFFEAWKYENDTNLTLSLFTYIFDYIDSDDNWIQSLKKL